MIQRQQAVTSSNVFYHVTVGKNHRRCKTEGEAKYWEKKWTDDAAREDAAGMAKDATAIDRFLGGI